jgi:hypothetical protein
MSAEISSGIFAVATADAQSIASGVMTITQAFTVVSAETSTTDDLDTISLAGSLTLGTYRPIIILQAASGHTITVKHGTGNISLNGAADFSLTDAKMLALFYNGTNWYDLGAGGSGGSGAPTDATYITQTANGSLSAEQALSTLQTGAMIVTNSTGVITSLKHNLVATAAPTVDNDTDENYSIGSLWVDVTADNVYMAVDVTDAAAVWRQLNLDIDSLASGTPVGTDTLAFKDVDDSNTPKEATIATILALGGGGSTPRGHIIGLEVNVTGDEAITIAEGQALDDTHANLMVSANGGGSVDMTTTGINALDTGTIASNTKYAVWMCKGDTGTGFVASLSFTAPTLPTGYDDFKRYIGAVVTDATSDLIKQKTVPGSGCKREVRFTEITNVAPYRILDQANLGNGSGAATTVDCSGLLPTTARWVIAMLGVRTASATSLASWFVNSVTSVLFDALGANDIWYAEFVLELDSSQAGAAFGDANDEDFIFSIFGYYENLNPDLVSA